MLEVIMDTLHYHYYYHCKPMQLSKLKHASYRWLRWCWWRWLHVNCERALLYFRLAARTRLTGYQTRAAPMIRCTGSGNVQALLAIAVRILAQLSQNRELCLSPSLQASSLLNSCIVSTFGTHLPSACSGKTLYLSILRNTFLQH